MSTFFSSISATYNTALINYVEFLYQIIEKSRRTQQSTSFGKAEKTRTNLTMELPTKFTYKLQKKYY